MFYAGGYAAIFNEDANLVQDVHPASVSIGGESETAEANGIPWEPGPVQVLASAQISSTLSATLNFQKVNSADLALILNTQLATATSFDFPEPFQATVPATPFEIAIAGLTLDQDVIVGVSSNGVQQKLVQVPNADTLTSGQYKVAAGKIIFHSSQAGQVVTGVYYKSVASARSLGGTTASTSYGTIQFFGRILGTEENMKIWIKQFTPNGSFDLGLIGAAGDDISVEGVISAPQGWNRPYWITFG